MSLIKFNKTSADTNGNNADQVQILQDDEFQDRVSSADLRSPDTYKTPFGEIPIEKFTKIHIGILLAFATVMTYAMIITHDHYLDMIANYIIARQVLTIIGCVLMTMALKKKRPVLYLPFLITNGIWTLIATLFVLYGLWSVGLMLFQPHRRRMRLVHWIRLSILLFEQMLFYGYMEIVFLKAYMYMKRNA
ncbi:hypothetical protein Ddc_15255 [Ditylenchus destructor]|nr:hypothetical protein Ddc_15255 [Ditylenchus destructor]